MKLKESQVKFQTSYSVIKSHQTITGYHPLFLIARNRLNVLKLNPVPIKEGKVKGKDDKKFTVEVRSNSFLPFLGVR